MGSQVNTWVYTTDGDLLDGWPQLDNASGYAYGVYNSNAAVHDLDKDGQGEIVVPSDVHYICAYAADGSQLPAHSIYGGKGWGKVGVWESLATERRGWGTCSAGDARAERYRTNFAHGASVIADVDGDGRLEVIVTGNVYDCAVGHPPGKYNGVYLFNADRSRFNRNGYDWRSVPINTGAPLSEDYEVIENNQPNPVVVDLDGDGQKEILYASYDGRVHAFWLDKTEHGAWPYSVYKAQEGVYRFASEPVVADLNNDGRAEVLFASWVQKGSGKTGKLHILDWQGQLLHQVALPLAFGGENWNGALAAPTLANIDDDPDLEVVLNTAHAGFVAYDLPGTARARILWGTGRGNYQRTGTAARSTAAGHHYRHGLAGYRAGHRPGAVQHHAHGQYGGGTGSAAHRHRECHQRHGLPAACHCQDHPCGSCVGLAGGGGSRRYGHRGQRNSDRAYRRQRRLPCRGTGRDAGEHSGQ